MKRCIAFLLALLLTMSLCPVVALAEQPSIQYDESYSITAEDDLGATNDELFAAYAQREFDAALGIDPPSFWRTSALKAGTLEKELYDKLKIELAKVAAGIVTSTTFVLQPTATWSLTELGVTSFLSGNEISNETSKAIGAKLTLVYNCLLADCPLELYWHDKTENFGIRKISYYCNVSDDETELIISNLSLSFSVAKEYSATNTAGTFVANSSKTGATSAAVANAKAIVAANASKSDYEKLKAYNSEICNLVSYNQSAITNATPYGNPWQMIYVFDKNNTTNVVCEGYAKAFQYLCDLTTFSGDVECHTVFGFMTEGTGEGEHMWNVVTMDDGKNYLVDVTNCDSGSIGAPDKLFLAHTANSTNANKTHIFTIDGQNISFTYDETMKDMFCNGYLPLATTAYAKPNAPIYEARWGVATGANNDGKPDDGNWTNGTLTDAMTYANGLTSGTAYIQLLSDVDTTAPLEFASGKTTILDLNGNDIDRGLTEATDYGNVITVNGNLTLCDSSANAATSPGKITGGNNTESGGGVLVGSGTFTMNGGAISGNTAERGGGVNLFYNSVFTMTGGTISGNTAQGTSSVGGCGGGIRVGSGCTFMMNGGTISGNISKYWGGGVYDYGIFAMSGGTISGNTAQGGGGVCADGAIMISGTPVISGNFVGEKLSNVWLKSGNTILVMGKLQDGASIGVTPYYTAPTEAAPVPVATSSGYTLTASDAAKFSSDENYFVSLDAENNAVCLTYVEQPETTGATRVYGSTRYETAFKAADALKENMGVDKFDAVVVACGTDFADALSGSYLSCQKNAPILLVRNNGTDMKAVKDYIKENVKVGGTVYLLGGAAVVPAAMENDLDDFTVKRLAGSTRYVTNLEILNEAGMEGKDLLVCSGKSFPDGLSASATNLPVLLVKDSLSTEQRALLSNHSGKIYIIGGTGAVSTGVENALKAYGTTERIGGATRYETSVNIAKKFFPNTQSAVLAYGVNFPDGLSGGPLAANMNAPLIMTAPGKQGVAVEYARQQGIIGGYVLGGSTLITDYVVRSIFGLATDAEINVSQ